jgi:hypothetical protein
VFELLGLALLKVGAFVVWRVMFRPRQKAQHQRRADLEAAAPALGMTYAGTRDPVAGDQTFPYEYQQPKIDQVLRGSSLGRPAYVLDVRYEAAIMLASMTSTISADRSDGVLDGNGTTGASTGPDPGPHPTLVDVRRRSASSSGEGTHCDRQSGGRPSPCRRAALRLAVAGEMDSDYSVRHHPGVPMAWRLDSG